MIPAGLEVVAAQRRGLAQGIMGTINGVMTILSLLVCASSEISPFSYVELTILQLGLSRRCPETAGGGFTTSTLFSSGRLQS